jgi:hypothetical protein
MSFVVKLHQFMRKLTKDEQMPDDSILVLPWYNQKRQDLEALFRRHGYSNIAVKSVDSVQRLEARIVIIPR